VSPDFVCAPNVFDPIVQSIVQMVTTANRWFREAREEDKCQRICNKGRLVMERGVDKFKCATYVSLTHVVPVSMPRDVMSITDSGSLCKILDRLTARTVWRRPS